MAEATELLTVDEAATLLKRHPSTIYRRLERGEWPFARFIADSLRIVQVEEV